jgi:uncharacterized cupin superfamily protein
MTQPRHPNVVHASEVEAEEIVQGKHHVKRRMLGPAVGGHLLGASLTEIPPGAVSFPFHYHCATEEAVYVISGTGTARIGDQRVAVGAGDYLAHPVGPEHAHQMINDGNEPLVYLCFSTRPNVEIVGYPDSKKIGTRAGTSPTNHWLRTMTRDGEPLEYFDGEPDA